MKNASQNPAPLAPLASRIAVAALTVVAFSWGASADAQTINKANNTTALNLAGSWVSGGPPGSTNIAQWTSTVTAANTTVLGADQAWLGIKIVGPGGTVTINSGNTLTLGASGIDMTTATQNLTLNPSVILSADQDWNAQSGRTLTKAGTTNLGGFTLSLKGSGTKTITGVISNGALAVSAGTSTLSGANTFAGGVTLSGGTLNMNSSGSGGTSSAIGTGALTITGGTIGSSAGSAVALSTNNVQAWNGNFTFGGSQSLNLGTGAVTMSANRTVTIGSSGDTLTVGGIISGTGFSLSTANNTANTITGILALNGANTYSGGTNVNGGLVRFGAGAIPASGTISIGISGAVSVSGDNATLGAWLADARLSNTSSGALALAGSSAENFNPGAAGFGSISLGASLGVTASYTGDLAPTGSTYRVGGGGGTISFDNTDAFTGANDLIAGNGGSGTVILAKNNSLTGTTTIARGTLQVGAGGTVGSLGSTSSVSNSGTLAFNRSDDLGFNTLISGSGGVSQLANSILTLGVTNAYTGATLVSNGTIKVGATNALGTSSALTLGSGTTAGNLDASGFNQAVAAMNVAQNSTTETSTLTIGGAQVVTASGNVTIGSTASGVTTTKFAATGGGVLTVTNSASNGIFQVGGSTSGTSGDGNIATADLSGLSTFNLTLSTSSGTLRVNDNSGTNSSGIFSTLLLPTTGAGTTTIVTNTIAIGDGGRYNGVASPVHNMKLGTGVSTLRANIINIGTGARDFGALTFTNASGSVIIRDAAGTGRAALNIGTGSGVTGVGTGSNGNVFDVSGHNADLLLGAVSIGTQARGEPLVSTFTFDQGTLDMTNLTLSTRSGSTTNGTTRQTDTVVNLGGGTVAIQNGILQMSQTSGTPNSGSVQNATINVYGSSVVNVGATGGTSVTMATAIANTTSNAVLNLTGGTTTFAGNIVKGGGVGTTSATLTLDGGTLDMSGKNIGDGTNQIDALNLRSGTLQNVAQINGGGAISKTAGAGNNTLILAGVNTYTGATNVDAGTVLVSGSISGSAVNVNNGGILGGAGFITTMNQAITLAAGGKLSPGASAGNLTVNTGSAQMDLSAGVTAVNSRALIFELGSIAASDKITLTGSSVLNIGAGVLAFDDFVFSNLGGLETGSYTLFDGVNAIVGSLDPNGANLTGSLGGSFTGTLAFGDNGNDLVLQVVPEPGTLVSLLGGLGMLAGLQRFRRRRG